MDWPFQVIAVGAEFGTRGIENFAAFHRHVAFGMFRIFRDDAVEFPANEAVGIGLINRFFPRENRPPVSRPFPVALRAKRAWRWQPIEIVQHWEIALPLRAQVVETAPTTTAQTSTASTPANEPASGEGALIFSPAAAPLPADLTPTGNGLITSALGPNKGPFEYAIHLTIRGAYDDNIGLTHTNPLHDRFVEIQPSVLLGLGDLVKQDTFLAALKAQNSFGGKSSAGTWLVGILRHKIYDHLRKTCRERAVRRAPRVPRDPRAAARAGAIANAADHGERRCGKHRRARWR